LHKAAKYATHFRAQAKVQQSTKQYANCPTNPHPRLSAGRKMASRRLSGQEILFSVFGAIPSAACVKRLLSDLSQAPQLGRLFLLPIFIDACPLGGWYMLFGGVLGVVIVYFAIFSASGGGLSPPLFFFIIVYCP